MKLKLRQVIHKVANIDKVNIICQFLNGNFALGPFREQILQTIVSCHNQFEKRREAIWYGWLSFQIYLLWSCEFTQSQHKRWSWLSYLFCIYLYMKWNWFETQVLDSFGCKYQIKYLIRQLNLLYRNSYNDCR